MMKNNPTETLIWPRPSKCQWENGFFDLGAYLTIIEIPTSWRRELSVLASLLGEVDISTDQAENGNIAFCKSEDEKLGSEGYRLTVDNDGICIEAQTETGAFYAVQTLVQLIRQSENKKIHCVKIEDVPFKPVRGVHLYIPARTQIQWFKRFVDFLAENKYNTVILEIGASMEFDAHPELNTAWEGFCEEMMHFPGGPDGNGMQLSMGHFKDSVHIENGGRSFLKKDELVELINYMRARHFDIIPEVQGLSHAYWMLIAHPELAERAEDPYPDTWCCSKPETYQLYFECLQEIVDLIRPKAVHIGHDEYYTVAMCPQCGHKTGHELFAEDVLKIYKWLAARGIRTIVWSDKLVNYVGKNGYDHGGRERVNFNWKHQKPEVMKATWRAVDMLPDDLIVQDWYYSLDGIDTGSQDAFAQRGMQVIYGNFEGLKSSENGFFADLTQRMRRPNVIGAELSLWQEVSSRGIAIRGNLQQYLDVANILWDETYCPADQLETGNMIARLYPGMRDRLDGVKPASQNNPEFFDVDLGATVSLSNYPQFDFLRQTPAFPGAPSFHMEERLKMSDNCILAVHPAERVALPLEKRCRSLLFLHAYSIDMGNPSFHGCTYIGWEKEVVGEYTVVYENGETVSLLLEYSRNITAVNKQFCIYSGNPAYKADELAEVHKKGVMSEKIEYEIQAHSLFYWEWQNPRPDLKITQIKIQGAEEKKGDILLFAIAAVV